MKYLILLISFLHGYETALSQVVFGDPEVIRKDSTGFKLTGSFQVGLGWINPKDINQYIGKYMLSNGFGSAIALTNQTSPFKKYSFSDFYMQRQNSIGLSLTAQPVNRVRVRMMYEFSYNPSNNISLSSGYLNSDFDMHRNSMGISGQYFFHLNKFNHLLAGVSILRHYMTFQQFHAHAFGFRLELGYSFMIYPLEMDLFLYSDLAKGSVPNKNTLGSPNSIEFTGVFFGIRFTPWFY